MPNFLARDVAMGWLGRPEIAFSSTGTGKRPPQAHAKSTTKCLFLDRQREKASFRLAFESERFETALFIDRQREKAITDHCLASGTCLFLDRQGENAIASTHTETSSGPLAGLGDAFSSTERGFFDPSGWLLKASDA